MEGVRERGEGERGRERGEEGGREGGRERNGGREGTVRKRGREKTS